VPAAGLTAGLEAVVMFSLRKAWLNGGTVVAGSGLDGPPDWRPWADGAKTARKCPVCGGTTVFGWTDTEAADRLRAHLERCMPILWRLSADHLYHLPNGDGPSCDVETMITACGKTAITIGDGKKFVETDPVKRCKECLFAHGALLNERRRVRRKNVASIQPEITSALDAAVHAATRDVQPVESTQLTRGKSEG